MSPPRIATRRPPGHPMNDHEKVLREWLADCEAIRREFLVDLTPQSIARENALRAAIAAIGERGEPVAYCDPGDPRNSQAFAWPGSAREPRHSMPLYALPTPPTQGAQPP